MEETPAAPVTRKPRGASWRWLLLVVMIALLAAGGFFVLRARNAGRQGEESRTLSSSTAAAVEERFGIRVTLLAVTAAGGFVDLRFQVFDADKAAQLLQPENLPVLVAEDSGVTLKLSAAPDQETLVPDQVYFFLYPNARNAIESGSLVTVVMGDLRLEHLVAQ